LESKLKLLNDELKTTSEKFSQKEKDSENQIQNYLKEIENHKAENLKLNGVVKEHERKIEEISKLNSSKSTDHKNYEEKIELLEKKLKVCFWWRIIT
jgi:hypothetical protein